MKRAKRSGPRKAGTKATNPMIAAALAAGKDTTGLCTVRECAALMIERGSKHIELFFVDGGMRRNVEIIVTRNEAGKA